VPHESIRNLASRFKASFSILNSGIAYPSQNERFYSRVVSTSQTFSFVTGEGALMSRF
jgi:hypothetical protein